MSAKTSRKRPNNSNGRKTIPNRRPIGRRFFCGLPRALGDDYTVNPLQTPMSPFHSGLNHWQRQWLSDRLHKKDQDPGPIVPSPSPLARPKRKAAKKSKAAKKRPS